MKQECQTRLVNYRRRIKTCFAHFPSNFGNCWMNALLMLMVQSGRSMLIKLDNKIVMKSISLYYRWSDTGKSIIMDKTLFHTSIFVQRIFKSIQWKSFVRQLNMYGFHKSLPIHQHSQEEPCPCNCHVVTSIYYTHEHFRRWNFNDLTLVTRPKKSKSGFLNTVTENTKVCLIFYIAIVLGLSSF